jgi:RNA polymerase sigma-70 factor (ECF subfamily)
LRTKPTDAQLLDRWAEGDTAACRILLDRHFEGLARFFRNKVSAGVEDLIQQTLMTCVRRREALRDRASFRAYLYTVARRLVHEHCRKLRREHERFDPLQSSVADLRTSPSQFASRREEHRLLLMALQTLPLDLQITLELRYWEQLSGPELADVLGVPEGTVRSRIRRGTALLRDALARLGTQDLCAETSLADFQAWAAGIREHVGPSQRNVGDS